MKKALFGILLAFCATTQAYEPLDAIAAVVNDSVITTQDLKLRLEQIHSQGHALPEESILTEQVLSHLISEKVQLQRASETGIRLDQATIDLAIEEIAQNNHMTIHELRQQVEAGGQSYEEFRIQVGEEITLSRLYQRDVASGITITDKEIAHFLASAEGQSQTGIEYRLRHILLTLPQAPSPADIATVQTQADDVLTQLANGADFEALAMAHSRGQYALEGGDLGWRKGAALPALFANRVQHLALNEVAGPFRNASGFHLIQLVDKRSPATKQSKTVHARHLLLKSSPLQSDEDIAEQLSYFRTLLEAGEVSFEQLAKDHSDDMATAHQGGDLGWVLPEDMPGAFEESLTNLPLNAISAPLKTAFGWHIMQVLERGQPNDLAEPREQARRFLHTRKFDERLENYKRQLLAEAYIVRSSL